MQVVFIVIFIFSHQFAYAKSIDKSPFYYVDVTVLRALPLPLEKVFDEILASL